MFIIINWRIIERYSLLEFSPKETQIGCCFLYYTKQEYLGNDVFIEEKSK